MKKRTLYTSKACIGRRLRRNIVGLTALTALVTAGCTGESSDPDGRNASSQDSAATAVDLLVSVTDEPDPASVGDTVEFVTTVEHRGGNHDAQNVVVTGSWNADIASFQAGRMELNGAAVGACVSDDPGQVSCTLGQNYAFGQSLVVIVDTVTTQVGILASTWSVAHDADRDTSNDSVQETTAVYTEVENTDLYITSTDTPDPATVGGTVNYAVEVGNNGPADASGASATVRLDASSTFQSVDHASCAYDGTNHEVNCAFANLAVGASVTANISVVANTGGIELTSTATVRGASVLDSQPANNVAVATTSVLDYLVDLSITIDAARWIAPADALDYTVTVTNEDLTNRNANDVEATIALPEGFAVTALPSSCNAVLNTVTCDLGTIPAGGGPGSTVSFDISGRTSLCVDYQADASVSAAQADYEPSNDDDSALTSCVNCDDQGSCTTDTLNREDGSCSNVQDPAANCDDGSLCTADLCDARNNCENTNVVECPNDNGTDLCAARHECEASTGACVVAREEVVCDDGVDCTEDSCQAGICVYAPQHTLCDDGATCTDNVCSVLARGCVFPPHNDRCDDNDACTGDEVCDTANGAAGTGCVAGEVLNCDDGFSCTTDSCDAAEGCVNAPVHTSCDDGNECTQGVCSGGLGADEDGCVFPSTPLNGASCTNDNQCTENNVCTAGVCAAGTPVDCDDDKTCTDDSCEPAVGCINKSALCDDGNPCDGYEVCDGEGNCSEGTPPDCDDDNPCTADRCDQETGACINEAIVGFVCNDGDACTAVDQCNADGECVGQDVRCPNDDGSNSCAPVHSCNADTGLCHVAEGDGFEGCDDGNACTDDSCDPESGCVYDNVVCDNDDACDGVETCNPEVGCVEAEDKNCDDGNQCTIDSCDSRSGECVNTIAVGALCDDALHCTAIDTCDAEGVCGGEPVRCANQDGNNGCADRYACSEEAEGCERIYEFEGCDDGDACTEESCNPLTPAGCESEAVVCSDDDVCNGVEVCNSETGCELSGADGEGALDCDDGNPCTIDSCDPLLGCQHDFMDELTAAATLCDDGDACTFLDNCNTDGTCTGDAVRCLNEDGSNQCLGQYACEEGNCVEQVPAPSCDDSDACTDDSCDPGVEGGCVNAPTVCDDGIDCTVDSCDAATGCVATTDDSLCEDTGNICTTPVCNELLGCIVDFADGEACDDASGCTTEDTCLAGLCVGTLDPNCSQCTVSDCDPATGECTEQAVADGQPCVNPDGISCPTTCLDNFIDGTVIEYELPETSSMDPQVTVEWLVDDTNVTYNLHPEHTLTINNDGSIFIGTPATFGADGRLEHPAADDEDLYAQLYVECTAVTPALFDANGNPQPDTGYNALDPNNLMCWIDEAEVLFPGTPGTFPQQPCAELVTPRIERTAEYHIEGARICIEMVLYVNQAGAITSEDGSCGDAEAKVTVATCLNPISCSPASCEAGVCQPSDMCVVETECIEVLIDDEVPTDVPEDFSTLIDNCITADCTQDCAASLEDNPECQATCVTTTATRACGHLIDDAVELQECVTVTSRAKCDAYCAQIGDPDPGCSVNCQAEICIDNMTYLGVAGTPVAMAQYANCAQVVCRAEAEGANESEVIGDGDGKNGSTLPTDHCGSVCFQDCMAVETAGSGDGMDKSRFCRQLCTNPGGPTAACFQEAYTLTAADTTISHEECLEVACRLEDAPEAALCEATGWFRECLDSQPGTADVASCVTTQADAYCRYQCDDDAECHAACGAQACLHAVAQASDGNAIAEQVGADICIELACQASAGGDPVAAAQCQICYDVLVFASFLPDDIVLQNCLDTDDPTAPPGGGCEDPTDPCCQVCTGNDGGGTGDFGGERLVVCPPQLCEEQPQCFTTCSDAAQALLAEGADGKQIAQAFQLCLDTCTACPDGLENCKEPPFCVPSEDDDCGIPTDPCKVSGGDATAVAECLCNVQARVDAPEEAPGDTDPVFVETADACNAERCALVCGAQQAAGELPADVDCGTLCNPKIERTCEMNCAIKHSRLEDAEGFAACVEQCDPTEGCQRACDALYGVDGLAKQTACHQFCVGELPCLSRCQEEIADGTLSPETNCTQVCRVNACNIAGAVEATVHDGTGESVDVPEPAACDPKRCLDHCVQMKSVGDLQADVRCSDYCVLPTACETSCAAQQAAGELAEGLDCQAFCGEVDCQNVCQLQIDSELLPEGTDCGAVCDVRPVNECAGYCAKVLTQDGSEMDADDAARCVAVCTKAPPAEFCEALPKEMRAGCLTDLCRGQAELGNEFASCKLTDCFDAAAVEGDADRQACIATTTDAGCARQCAGLEGGDGEECLARCQLDACTFSDTYGAAVDAHAANAYCVRSFCGSDATAECEACVDAAAQERTLALEEAGAPVDFSQQYHFCRSEFGEGLPSGGE